MVAFSVLPAIALVLGVAQAIYPENHWEKSVKITKENADAFVKEHVDAGRTVIIRAISKVGNGDCNNQAPAWNKVIEDWKDNDAVIFGDSLLKESPVTEIHGVKQRLGRKGWPTIRYFNKETGYGGEPYPFKTRMAPWKELGPEFSYLHDFVEEVVNSRSMFKEFVAMCDQSKTEQDCKDAQEKFTAKFGGSPEDLKTQLTRLQKTMEEGDSPVRPEALEWVLERIAQLSEKSEL
eukprot:gb/GFBE01051959.1/.p1 GENE.gb/GFBE01051959.1/~~gb/GFBE01051959.1/.p1  ORF type:complete len:235 (+),score=69.19 gb/GFBE01051959.1/:1-705(+)